MKTQHVVESNLEAACRKQFRLVYLIKGYLLITPCLTNNLPSLPCNVSVHASCVTSPPPSTPQPLSGAKQKMNEGGTLLQWLLALFQSTPTENQWLASARVLAKNLS